MVRRISGLFLGLGVIALVVAGLGAADDKTLTGEDLFGKYKCKSCHSLEALGIERKASEDDDDDEEGPDLSGVGLEHEADWMAKFLLKKEKLDGEKHEKKFRGKAEELDTLTVWLASMKVDSLALVKMKAAKEKE